MKKIGMILSILAICVLIIFIVITYQKENKLSDKAVNKATEEFTFDYEEKIIVTSIERFNNDYIVTIYGEEHYGVYLYKNGEIWNYINESN